MYLNKQNTSKWTHKNLNCFFSLQLCSLCFRYACTVLHTTIFHTTWSQNGRGNTTWNYLGPTPSAVSPVVPHWSEPRCVLLYPWRWRRYRAYPRARRFHRLISPPYRFTLPHPADCQHLPGFRMREPHHHFRLHMDDLRHLNFRSAWHQCTWRDVIVVMYCV